jgi:hypothetical protein
MVEIVGENVYKFVKFVSPLGIDFSVCTHFGKVFTTSNFILFYFLEKMINHILIPYFEGWCQIKLHML